MHTKEKKKNLPRTQNYRQTKGLNEVNTENEEDAASLGNIIKIKLLELGYWLNVVIEMDILCFTCTQVNDDAFKLDVGLLRE